MIWLHPVVLNWDQDLSLHHLHSFCFTEYNGNNSLSSSISNSLFSIIPSSITHAMAATCSFYYRLCSLLTHWCSHIHHHFQFSVHFSDDTSLTYTNTNKNLYSAKFVDKNETEALKMTPHIDVICFDLVRSHSNSIVNLSDPFNDFIRPSAG